MKPALISILGWLCLGLLMSSCGGSGGQTQNLSAPTITWPAPASITYGTALSTTQLDATANYAGTFSYSPAAGTILHTGTQTLKATFTPADPATVQSATATNTITVNPATPVVTWNTPAPVFAGTALGIAQLAATANIPGAFFFLRPRARS